MRIKLSPQALREVRRQLLSASLSRWLAIAATKNGDAPRARYYRLENSFAIAQARIIADRDRSVHHQNKYCSRMVFEEVQNEPAPEQVSAPAARKRLRLFGVLGSGRFHKAEKWCGLNYRIIEYDGIDVWRDEFPRLSKHWAPASILDRNQKRKRHAICRA